MKILNFGSLNIDYVYAVDHMVRAGETLSSKKLEVFMGGKGFNQSVALAQAGVKVYHAGMIGEDGQIFIDTCEKYGINTTHIKQIKGKSGHTIIQIDANAQNCILLHGGSNRSLTKEFIDETISAFEKDDYILLQNEVNHLDYIIESAYAQGMKIILNPSPYNSYVKACDLSKISYFLLNEIEGEQITGAIETDKMLKYFINQYPKAKIVLTLGSNGSIYKDCMMEYHQEICKVKAVDTTAAGDTFTGYFIAGLINNKKISENLKMCAMASAIAVSRKGASPSIPMLSEVEDALEHNINE